MSDQEQQDPTPGIGADAGDDAARRGRKGKKIVNKGVAHIKATFNNTHITLTSVGGDTISWGSAGTVGFKGTRKSTPFAAQRAAETAAQAAMRHGLKEVEVRVIRRATW